MSEWLLFVVNCTWPDRAEGVLKIVQWNPICLLQAIHKSYEYSVTDKPPIYIRDHSTKPLGLVS